LRTRRGRVVLSGVAVLLVAAILGLVFADVLAKPAKTDNGVATRGAAVSVTTTTTVPEGNPSTPAGTQAPAETVQAAAQAVATTVEGGIADATIRPGAGHFLMDLVTPLTGKPYDHTREVQRFNVLAQTVYKDLTRGAIKGTTRHRCVGERRGQPRFRARHPGPLPDIDDVDDGPRAPQDRPQGQEEGPLAQAGPAQEEGPLAEEEPSAS
jgi:hypothetical protein